MTAASTPAATDGSTVDRSHRVNRRLQLWGGGAAIVGALFTFAPNLLFVLGLLPGQLQQVLTIIGGLLMVASAVLLAKAFVGDRARFSLAKLGGILLIIFHCWWLAVLLVTVDWWVGGQSSGMIWSATRLLIGVAAGIAIATSWPARGFNQWSMLIVAACFGLAIYGAHALILSLGQPGAEGAVLLSYLQPLSLLAFGAGHATSGWRGTRAADSNASA